MSANQTEQTGNFTPLAGWAGPPAGMAGTGPGEVPAPPDGPRPWEAPIPDAEAVRIAADIDRQGYGVLNGFLTEQDLAPIRAIVHAAVDAAGGEYVGFNGSEALVGTVLAALPNSAPFKALCRRLYELGTGRAAPAGDFYQILRCLKGRSGQARSWYFHYDSYVVTALLPVAIPGEGRSGDLMVIPGTRPVRRFYPSNLLDKLLIENRIAQRFLRAATQRRRLNSVSIPMRPGDLYFFWGYRSIHTNAPCDPDKLRATALLHYGDPHRDSFLRRMVRRGRSSAGAEGVPSQG